MSTSRRVRPAIGKSAGASIARTPLLRARRGGGRLRDNDGWRGHGDALRLRRREILGQLLEHAGGFLAAGHAQVQPLLLAQKDRVRIILAVIAALAAILLAHRRHHPPPQRTAVGELHALGERQGLVVPRRRPVVTIVEGALQRAPLY